MTEKDEINELSDEKTGRTPDEKGGFIFSSAIKIFDPNTEEVLVQQRGDY
jgi:hypothetical protein